MSIYASSSTVTQQTTPRIVVDPATVQEGWILVWDEEQGVFLAQPAVSDDSGQLISLRGILSVEECDSNGDPVADADSDGYWLDYDETTGIFKFYRPSLDQLGVTAAIAAITLNDLADVDVPSAGAADGQILVWNDSSSAWEPQDLTITESDISLELGDLLDVTLTSLQEGDILVYNGSDQFVNRPLTLDDIDLPSGGDTGDILVMQSSGNLAFEPLVIDIADLVDQQSTAVRFPSLEIDWDQIIDATIPRPLLSPSELFDLLVDSDNDSTDGSEFSNVLQAAVGDPARGIELGDLIDVELAELEDGDGIVWDAGAGDWVPADMSDHKHTADDILFNDMVPSTTLTGCVANPKVNAGHKIIINGQTITFDGTGVVSTANLVDDIDAALGSDWAVTANNFKTPHTDAVTSPDQYLQLTHTPGDIILAEVTDAAEAGYSYSIIGVETNTSDALEIQTNANVDFGVGDIVIFTHLTGSDDIISLNKEIYQVASKSSDTFTVTNISGGDSGIPDISPGEFGGVGFVSSKPLDLLGFEVGTHYQGQLDDALIGASSVKQHQGALEVYSSQIVDLDSQFRVELDLNPQLGGDLDLNGRNITGVGVINITGTVSTAQLSGDVDGDVTGNLIGNVQASDGTNILTNGSVDYPKFNIISISEEADAEIVTYEDHGLITGNTVKFENITGGASYLAMNGSTHTVKSVTSDSSTYSFTIELDTSGYGGTYTGGGIVRNMSGSSDTFQNDAVFYGTVVSPFGVDTDGNIVADPDAGTYVGTLYGNVVGGVVSATTINVTGEINGAIEGDVNGDLTGNVLAPDGITIILDNGTVDADPYLDGNIFGDVFADDGNFRVLQNSVDGHPDVKSGTWGGKVYDFAGGQNTGFDRDDLPQDIGYGGWDIGQPWFKGGIKAASEDIDGNWETDIAVLYPGGFADTTNGALGTREEYLWDAWFRGDVIAKDGSIVLDNGTDGSDGRFYGDVYAQDADGNQELILQTGTFSSTHNGDAWVKGDVVAEDGTKIVENGTDGSDAEFMGDLYAQDDGGNTQLIVDTGTFVGGDYQNDATYMGDVIADDGNTLVLGNGSITETAINISNITPAASEVIVQTSGDHGFAQGNIVKITGVIEPTDANGTWLVDLTKPGLASNEFRLLNVDSETAVSGDDWANYQTSGVATECAYDHNATYMGDVLAEDGVTRIVDNGLDGSDAKFMGDLYAQDAGGDNIELVLHAGSFDGSTYNDDSWFKGDIKNEDGTIILDVNDDVTAAKYTGDMCGNLIGDIWAEGADPHDPADSHLKVLNNGFVNSDDLVEDAWFKGDLIGNVKGDVYAYDEDTEECFQVLESGTFTGSTYDEGSAWFLGGLRGDVYADDHTTIVLNNGTLTGNKYDITGFTADADSVILTATGHNIEVGETVTITGVAGTGNNLGALNGTHAVISAGTNTFEVALSDASTKVGTYTATDPLGCVRNNTVEKFDFNIDDDTGHAKFYGAHYGNIYATDGTKVGENGTDGTDAWYAGDLRNPDNTIILNVGRDNTEQSWFAGDLVNDDGVTILDVEDSAGDAWYYGNMDGDQIGDVFAEDGVTKIMDNGSDGTDAWFMGDIKDEDGDVVVEIGGGSTPTMFTGDLTGDVYDEDGALILDVNDPLTGEALLCANVKGNIVAEDGSVILENGTDSTNAWFKGDVDGDLTGDVLAEDGTKVFENGEDGTDAAATADILANDGTQVLENGTDGEDAWFMGDIIAPGTGDDSTPIKILDIGTTDGNGDYNDDACLDAKVKGDVVAEDGTLILENGTDGSDAVFTGKVEGDLCGDVYNEDGALILESGGGSVDAYLNADVNGDLTGDVYNTSGDMILDIEFPNTDSPMLENFVPGEALYTGNILGDMYDDEGNKVFDAATGEFDLGNTQILLDSVFDVFVADYGDETIHNPADYPDNTRWGRIFDVNSSDGGLNNWTPENGRPLGFSTNILNSTSTSTSDWESGWIPLDDIIVDSITTPTVNAEDVFANTLVLPYLYDNNDDDISETLGGIYNTAGELIFNAGDADNVATYKGDLYQDTNEKVYDSITNIYSGGLLLDPDTDAVFEGVVDLSNATVIGGDKFGIKYLTELEDTYEPGVLNIEVTSSIGGTSTLQQLPLYNGIPLYEQSGVVVVLKELNGDPIPSADYTLETDSSVYTGDITFVNPRATNFIAEYQIPSNSPNEGDPLVWTDNYQGTGEGRWYPGTATNIFLDDIDKIGNVDTSPFGEALVDGAYLRWDNDYEGTGKWVADNAGRNLDGLDDLSTENMDNSDTDSNDYVDSDNKPALIFDPNGGDDSSGIWRPSAVVTEYNMLAASSGYEFTAGFENRTDGFVGFDNGTNVDYTYDHVDNKEWMRFGFSDTNQVTVDTPYWADTTDPSSPSYVPGSTEAPGFIDGSDWNNRTHTGAHEGVGAFGGAYMPGGVRDMFDFDDNTDYNLASSDQTATQNGGLIYNAAQGSLRMDQLNAGDKCMFRFDFNIIPQVVNTTVEVGLIWSTRTPNNIITYTFALTTQPLFFGQGTIGKSFLNRPLITAYIASGEDINARALPAIRCSSPVLIQPLSILYTVIR